MKLISLRSQIWKDMEEKAYHDIYNSRYISHTKEINSGVDFLVDIFYDVHVMIDVEARND